MDQPDETRPHTPPVATDADALTKPPRARVEDAIDPDASAHNAAPPRERDYLEGFLQQSPAQAGTGDAGGAGSDLQTAVIDALKAPTRWLVYIAWHCPLALAVPKAC